MIKVITYGTFDMLHHGHINLLKRAKALGDYLIVGVTTDNFDKDRGKLNVRNNVMRRVESVMETGLADEIVLEEYVGQKIDDIQKFGVDIFAIGSDWEGKFDYLDEYCKIVYLPRTEGISSSLLRDKSDFVIRLGVVGTGRIAKRFVSDAKSVGGVTVESVYNPINEDEAENFSALNDIPYIAKDYKDLCDHVDAVYIASPPLSHYEYCKEALLNGRHVLCEVPFVLKYDETKELFDIAKERNLVLLEANKTAFCPSFNHLITLIKSGLIGDVVDVEASISKLVSDDCREMRKDEAGGSITENVVYPLLPIVKLFGDKFKSIDFYSKFRNGVDIYTKGIISYDSAVSSFKVGLGVKTEGNLVISGTKGYLYVPAPWWKTDYFEFRFENINDNKKYFYSFDGEGLRYELQEFLSCIKGGRCESYMHKPKEILFESKIIEAFRNNINVNVI